MIVKCGKCGTNLKFDETKYAQNKELVLKCPKCQAKNKVVIPGQQTNFNTITDDTTLVDNGNDDKTLVDNTDYSKQASPNPQKKGKEIIGWLVLHTENVKPITYELYEGDNILGRPTNDNSVDVPIANDRYVSRKHCCIQVVGSHSQWQYLLFDKGSTNGTYLNTEKLKSQDQMYLVEGDTVQAGRTKFVFKSAQKSKDVDDAAKTVLDTDYEKTVLE